MPHLKDRTKRPPWEARERAARISGVRNAIYDSRGNFYRGEWQDDKKHGHGMQVWKTKNLCYNGQWVKGRREGYGTLSVLESGRCIYGGTWKADRRHGTGMNFYSDGGTYQGEWNDNKRDGYGSMAFHDGNEYTGYWSDDRLCGRGTMTYRNGCVYEGEWFRDERHGKGKLKLPDGSFFEGSWQRDLKHGEGKFFFRRTGVEIKGVWLRDVPRCGTLRVTGASTATAPLSVEIPYCTLEDPEKVIDEAIAFFMKQIEMESPVQ